MENRFGLKDFILFAFLGLIGLLVVLAMVQFDRQWDRIKLLSDSVHDIQNTLSKKNFAFDGNPAAPATKASAADAKVDPFQRIRESQQLPDYSRGDWLVYGFGNNIAKLTPLLSGDLYAQRVQERVLESLATRDRDTLEFKPMLSTGWKIAPDGLTITFTMRPGVTFSDGEPLSADDVVFSYKFIMDEKIAAPRERAYYERMKDVVKSEDGTEVVFIFREPYFEAFLQASSLPVLPKHFYSKFKPQDFNQSVGLLMGSGPYKMEDPAAWKPGQLIQLVRNERYWGPQPALDRIVYKEISNGVALQTAFVNGDIDLIETQPDQFADLKKKPDLMARSQALEFVNPEEGYRFLAWNEAKGGKPTRFADKRVRRAMTMLVNRDRLIQEIVLGYGVPISGPFPPDGKQLDPSVKPLPFDVEGARKLLAQAGFTKTNDAGVLLGPDGDPFEFKLTYPSGKGDYERMVIALKDFYARVGIKLNPDPLEWASFTDRLNNKNFEAITLGWSTRIETDIYQEFHSSQMIEGGDDFISYKSEALDKAIEEARRTVDEPKRMAFWRTAHKLIADDQPYTFLWSRKGLWFASKRLHNVRVTKLGLNDFEEWFVPKGEQKWTK